MTVNTAQLEHTMRHIIDHPEEWNQGTYMCGTAACFAGHVVLANGWRPTFDLAPDSLGLMCAKDGCIKGVPHVAREILGISFDDSTVLFNGRNTLDDLQLMVKDLVDGESLQDLWSVNRGEPGYRWTRKP